MAVYLVEVAGSLVVAVGIAAVAVVRFDILGFAVVLVADCCPAYQTPDLELSQSAPKAQMIASHHPKL
ncbi:TMhelix containing protein [Vibrio phage 1.231.O._10N.261.49.F8]|nr:TMhelix containing protein [Vibrio phage 1.119.O._10N.261.51.A9]AUR90423.1 TMhelix containing protein [Vibrio phage 1.143.O._10N.261.55.C8]AUR96709.1 TMhelix containing protein [Vibrio phage 1.231.O._10N.261.49.F8]